MGAFLLIALLAIAAGGKSILFDTLDPDCFWHLRVADQLVREGIHPLIDEISFASIKQPWTPYSWLGELGMKAIWDLGGIRAAVATEAVLVAAFFTFVALAAIERSGKYFTSCVLTFLAMVLCLPYLSFRPVTMSLVLLSICWWLLMRDFRIREGEAPSEPLTARRTERLGRKLALPNFRAVWWFVPIIVINTNIHFFAVRDQKKGDSHLFLQKRWLSPFSVWWIVPITAINTNVHFFAAFAPFWVGCLLISKRRYLWLFIATSLACLCTPMLPGVIATVVHYQFDDPMIRAGVIAEFAPFYHGALGMTLAAILLALLACAIRNRRIISRSEWIAFAVGCAMLVKLGRFAPIFAIVAIPLFAATAPALRDRVLGKPVIGTVLSLCVLLATIKVTLALPERSASPDQWINRHGPDVPGYPVEATEFVAKNITPGTHHLVNEFTWGGYLAWRLGDRYQVLMDGRTQLYAPDFWRSLYIDPPDRIREKFSTISADAAILPRENSRLESALVANGWRCAHRDTRAAVFVPPGARIATID
jgi:hypothetical protein